METNSYKNLKNSLDLNKKAVAQLEEQMGAMDNLFAETVGGLKGEDKQKVQTLQAMVNRAIKKAQTGGDYNKVIEDIKQTFKTDLENGRNSNK